MTLIFASITALAWLSILTYCVSKEEDVSYANVLKKDFAPLLLLTTVMTLAPFGAYYVLGAIGG